jgi:mannosyltransferase OCH1-like enzyme
MKIYIIIIIISIIFLYLNYENSDDYKNYDDSLVNFPNFIKRKKKDVDIYNNVPLDIYQSWHTHNIPIDMSSNISNLLKINPEFNYHLYSDEECADFILKNFDEDVLYSFNTLIPGAYKSDLWRYCILFIKGGVYLDIKFYSNIPIISLLNENSTIFVKDRDFGCEHKKGIYNAFIVSPPNNKIFKYCIDDIVESCKLKLYRDGTLDITGPCLLGRIILKYEPEKYDNYIKNFKWDGNSILYGNIAIFSQYLNYRNNQSKFQKNKHYGELWLKRNVFLK